MSKKNSKENIYQFGGKKSPKKFQSMVFCNQITWLILGIISALHESSKSLGISRNPFLSPRKMPVPIMVTWQGSTTLPAGNVDTVEDGSHATVSCQAWLIMFTLTCLHYTTWWCSNQKPGFKTKMNCWRTAPSGGLWMVDFIACCHGALRHVWVRHCSNPSSDGLWIFIYFCFF